MPHTQRSISTRNTPFSLSSLSLTHRFCCSVPAGTYKLHWRSEKSGLYTVNVMVDGLHVINSPAPMRLVSGNPDFSRTGLSGGGLSNAIAGKQATIRVQCVDACGNPTQPEETMSMMKFGIALIKESSAQV